MTQDVTAATPAPSAGTIYTVGGTGVAWRETGGEIVVLDVTGSVYFGLNGTGAMLWRRLLDGASRDALVAELVSTAPVELEVARCDVDTYLVELQRHGLLHINVA